MIAVFYIHMKIVFLHLLELNTVSFNVYLKLT